MMKFIQSLFFGAVLLSSVGCSKVDDACIQTPQFIFFANLNDLSTCSSSDDYVLWEFSDGKAELGASIKHKFSQYGRQTIKQTVYSDDARNSSTKEISVEVGFYKIDSLVFTFINSNGTPEVPTPDLYVTINDSIRSNETYVDVNDRVVPRSFTFPENQSTLDDIKFDFKLIDYNETSIDLVLFDESTNLLTPDFSNPFVNESDLKFKYKVYWSFVATK